MKKKSLKMVASAALALTMLVQVGRAGICGKH